MESPHASLSVRTYLLKIFVFASIWFFICRSAGGVASGELGRDILAALVLGAATWLSAWLASLIGKTLYWKECFAIWAATIWLFPITVSSFADYVQG